MLSNHLNELEKVASPVVCRIEFCIHSEIVAARFHFATKNGSKFHFKTLNRTATFVP